jgi:hypothetical protein|tara:strand:- start:152 stop:427 length:276 start_codon:yes stop_codon:yes gene_type:complete
MGFFTGIFHREVVLSDNECNTDCFDRARSSIEAMGFELMQDESMPAVEMHFWEFKRGRETLSLRTEASRGVSLVASRKVHREFKANQKDIA